MGHRFEAGEDDLQRALVKLHLPLDAKEIAVLERAELRLRGVPHAPADGAGAIAQLHLQVKHAIAVGPQLLVADEKYVVERIAVGEVLHGAAGHGASLYGEARIEAVSSRSVLWCRRSVGRDIAAAAGAERHLLEDAMWGPLRRARRIAR